MSLLSRKEHNEKMMGLYKKPPKEMTGVQCEQCDGEFFFNSPGILMCSPPRRHVECIKCGATSNIIV